MKLPIDLIPNSHPPRFRWVQVVRTLGISTAVTHTGTLPTNVEDAVAKLVMMCKSQQEEIEVLRKKLESMSKPIPVQVPTIHTTTQSVNKNKGK